MGAVEGLRAQPPAQDSTENSIHRENTPGYIILGAPSSTGAGTASGPSLVCPTIMWESASPAQGWGMAVGRGEEREKRKGEREKGEGKGKMEIEKGKKERGS